MRTIDRVVVTAALMWLASGCSGGRSISPEIREGAASPEQAVETFLSAATEAQRARAAGEFTAADRAYERMAGVFGTEDGSVYRTLSAEEVRGRMLVLAACIRPTTFRITTQPDPQAWRNKTTVVTVQVNRPQGAVSLPFRLVLGRGDQWYIEQIDVSNLTC